MILLAFLRFFDCGKFVWIFRTKCGQVVRLFRTTTDFCQNDGNFRFLQNFVKFLLFHKILWKKKFYWSFPLEWQKLVSKILILNCQNKVFNNPKKLIKSMLCAYLERSCPPWFPHVLNIVEKMWINGTSFHNFIIY